ncbi:MAG: hypothetical protein ACOYLQ_09395 [Hyphomicrobiaceae bacterium]
MSFKFDGLGGTDIRPVSKTPVNWWAKDETAAGANDGTRLTATLINQIVANLRRVCSDHAVPLQDGADDLLSLAVAAAASAAVAGLAPLASPALTGVPTAPTASPGTNTTQIATMAAVQAAIANLIASSPTALNTLNELAAALGNDENFAATMTTALGLKAPLASPALTGIPTAPTAAPGTNTTQVSTTAFVTAAIAAISSLDATLVALAAVTTAADKLIYATGADTFSTTTITSYARSIIATADEAALKALVNLEAGIDYQAYDAAILKSNVTANLTKGFSTTPYAAGTVSSGTYTPSEANGPIHEITNGGAHTLAPPTNSTSLVVRYTNNGTAGIITTSGFTKVDGTAPGTVNGDDFLGFITKVGTFSHLAWAKLQ